MRSLLLLAFTLWRDRQAATLGLLIFLAQLAMAPLWLGPVVTHQIQGAQTINAAIALSPISYLATMVDYDYLHGHWFYQLTPLGSFRYDYPDGISLSIAYLSVILSALFVRHVLVTKRDSARIANNQKSWSA